MEKVIAKEVVSVGMHRAAGQKGIRRMDAIGPKWLAERQSGEDGVAQNALATANLAQGLYAGGTGLYSSPSSLITSHTIGPTGD